MNNVEKWLHEIEAGEMDEYGCMAVRSDTVLKIVSHLKKELPNDAGLAAVCDLLDRFAFMGERGPETMALEDASRVFEMAMKLAEAKRMEILARAHCLFRGAGKTFDAEIDSEERRRQTIGEVRGKTTALMLRAIADALLNPGVMVEFVDHDPMTSAVAWPFVKELERLCGKLGMEKMRVSIHGQHRIFVEKIL